MAYRPPNGASIFVSYPADEYAPPGPNEIDAAFVDEVVTGQRLSLTAGAWWGMTLGQQTTRRAVHTSARSASPASGVRWSVGRLAAPVAWAAWRPAIILDPPAHRVDWLSYGPLCPVSFEPRWRQSLPADHARQSAWEFYARTEAPEALVRWVGSTPADIAPALPWAGDKIPTWRPVPYLYSAIDGLAIDVQGGGLRIEIVSGAYTAPAGDDIDAVFDAEPYTPPLPLIPGTSDIKIPLRRAAFTVGPALEQRLDGAGQPILDTAAINTHRLAVWGDSKPAAREQDIPWSRYSRYLRAGWGVVVPSGPQQPDPNQQIIIPIRRAYIMINDVLLVRLDDSTVLDATQMQVAIDCDSWLPTWSATIPYAQRDAVMPDGAPVELMAYINGAAFRLLVEKIQNSRQFGQRSVSISGRGVAAELTSPYATASQHTNATTLTAQQLIDSALQYTGYTQVWDITDWSVPSGILSLQGTPADVALHVAEAAGAVLQAGWQTKTLRMLPRYPVKPWEWAAATPDAIIPSVVAQTESIEWIDNAEYNLVYVSGELAGVLGQVRIAGTAGDKPAPMVTHPLTTHADAARQRGTSILGAAGSKAILQISLPVLDESGIIDVCRLVEFTDGTNTRRGITRANTITVGFPTVRQTLTIEATP